MAVDPNDATAVADALADVIARREDLRWPAVDRAAEFSWSRTAERVEAIWRELAP